MRPTYGHASAGVLKFLVALQCLATGTALDNDGLNQRICWQLSCFRPVFWEHANFPELSANVEADEVSVIAASANFYRSKRKHCLR